MAQLLKATHELLALKVSLRVERRESIVALELESYQGGTPHVIDRWQISTRDVGLPRDLPTRGRLSFTFAPDVADALAARVAALGYESWHPLWLHLARPYGTLGALPWEDLLVSLLGRPVLRLPDFLERPRETHTSLDVALCCSAPLSEPNFNHVEMLAQLAAAVHAGSPRAQTRVHVFADADAYPVLRARLDGVPYASVADPEAARRYEDEGAYGQISDSGAVTSPWLLWMRDAMNGRSLDSVHFLCHGYLADQRGAIAVADTPLVNTDRHSARFVGTAELAAFLTQTGAWATTFSAPPYNYSDVGLRLLADTLAQVRPGPVCYHDTEADPSLGALHDACAFLFATEPSEAPVVPAGFMYCQPVLVDSQARVAPAFSLPAVDVNAGMFAAPAASEVPAPPPVSRGGSPGPSRGPVETVSEPETVPNWVSAAQRYVEGVALQMKRQEDVAMAGSRDGQYVRGVVDDTLERLQQIVGRFARAGQPGSDRRGGA